MIGVLLLALKCSDLPVTKWQHFKSAEGHFEVAYPPCWEAQTAAARVFLRSADGAVEIGLHVGDAQAVRSAAARIFSEPHREKKRCNVGGVLYDCAEWNDPDGHQTFIAIVHHERGYNVGVTSHDAKGSNEAAKILRYVRLLP